MKRAALYIDGFNFYYGVTSHFRPGKEERGFSLSGLCWCDFRVLIERHYLPAGFELGPIRYFTAPVTEKVETSRFPGEHERYELWMKAAHTIRGLDVIDGFHRPRGAEPGHASKARDEKLTDVNLAVELLMDGLNHVYDRAIVMSGDADQIPAVLAAALRLPKPHDICVLLPPGQQGDDWSKHCGEAAQQLRLRDAIRHHASPIQVKCYGEKELANSLLPYELDGVSCPQYWRLPPQYLDRMCSPECRPRRSLQAGG